MSNTITQNIIDVLNSSNSELYLGSNLAKLGDTYTTTTYLTVKAKVGYKLTSAKLIYTSDGGYDDFGNEIPAGEAEHKFTIESDGLTTRRMRGSNAPYSGIVITTIEYQPETYILKQSDVDLFAVAGVSLSAGGVVVGVGDNLGLKDLVFTADATHVISEAHATYIEQAYDKWGDLVDKEFETVFQVSTDSKSATGALLNKSYSSISVTTTVTEEPVTDNKNGFTNIYSLTNVDMVNVLKNSTYTANIGTEPTTIDGTTYIQMLYNLPFELSAEDITGKENVYLGDRDTEVNVDSIEGRDLYKSGGVISVPAVGNFTDFTNKKAILNLPFFNPIELDVENVIGFDVGIVYKINLYTGDCVVYVSSSKTGGEIASVSDKLGVEIPYKTAFIYSGAIKYGNNSSEIHNDLKTAYIDIYDSNDLDELENTFLAPITDNGNLNDVSGYVVVNDSEMNTNGVKNEEVRRIETMLKSGVIIK